MGPGKLQGCGRGVFGLTSWEPLRRPGDQDKHLGVSPKATTNGQKEQRMAASSNGGQSHPKKKQRVVAKYNYKANNNSPLGEELSVSQCEKLFFLAVHEDNPLWWMAQNDQGQSGYVPAQYMQVLEDQAPGLPWLQNREEEEEAPATNSPFGPPPKGVYKPYKSSYNHASEDMPKQHYCDICEKQFNGPKPYSAHMVSKAHREMEEYLSR